MNFLKNHKTCLCNEQTPLNTWCWVYNNNFIKPNIFFKTCKMKLNTIYHYITTEKEYIDFISDYGFFKLKKHVKRYFKINNQEWQTLCYVYEKENEKVIMF